MSASVTSLTTRGVPPGVVRVASELAETPADLVVGQVLPVRAELADLVPLGGLRRGSTISVRGSNSLLLALLATATTEGCWAAVVGMPDLGLLAAAELGVSLRLPWSGQLPRPPPAMVAAQPAPALVVDDGWEPVALIDRCRLTAPPGRVVFGTRLSLRVMGWAGPWFVDRNPAMAGGGVRSARTQVLLDRPETEQSDGTHDGRAHSSRAWGGGEQGDKTQGNRARNNNRARNKRAQGRPAWREPWWDGWMRNESAQLEEDAAAPPSSLALLLRCEDS